MESFNQNATKNKTGLANFVVFRLTGNGRYQQNSPP